MSIIAQEPRQMPQSRKCGHCHEPGHNVLSCELARYAGYNLHNRVINLIQINCFHANIEQVINPYLQTLTIAQLKLISYVRNDLNRFASRIYDENRITLRQAGLHNKTDFVVVLGFYYKNLYDINRETFFLRRAENFLRASTRTAGKKFNLDTEITDISNDESLFECPICITDVENKNRVTMNCNHDVCYTCVDQYLSAITTITPRCCLCRSNVTKLQFTNMELCNKIKNKYTTN
jgi:hypothetical protein